jgi:hypothetical protein
MKKNILFILDIKYTFLQTKTKANLYGKDENIDLSRLSANVGIGFLIEI